MLFKNMSKIFVATTLAVALMTSSAQLHAGLLRKVVLATFALLTFGAISAAAQDQKCIEALEEAKIAQATLNQIKEGEDRFNEILEITPPEDRQHLILSHNKAIKALEDYKDLTYERMLHICAPGAVTKSQQFIANADFIKLLTMFNATGVTVIELRDGSDS